MTKKAKYFFYYINLIFLCLIVSCNKSGKFEKNANSILESNGFEKLVDENKINEPFSENLKSLLNENDFEINRPETLREEVLINNDNLKEKNNFLNNDYYIETAQGRYIHESIIKKEVEFRLNSKLEEIDKSNKILIEQEILKEKENFEKNERKNIEAVISKKLKIRLRITKTIIIPIFSIAIILILIWIFRKRSILISEKNNREEIIKSHESQFLDELSRGVIEISELRKNIIESKDLCKTIALNNVENYYKLREKIADYQTEISELYEQINDQFATINISDDEKDTMNQVLDDLYKLGRQAFEKCYEVYLSIRNVSIKKDRQDSINFLFLHSKNYFDLAEQIESKIDEKSKFKEKLQNISSLYKSNAEMIKQYANELDTKK